MTQLDPDPTLKLPRRRLARPWRGLVAAGLLVGSMALVHQYTQRRQTVTLTINDVHVVHSTYARTAAEALQDTGIHLTPHDAVWLPDDAALSAGAPIELRISRRVWLAHDGSLTELYTQAESVGQALAEAEVSLTEYDEVWMDGQRLGLEATLPEWERPQRAGAQEWVAAIRQPLRLAIRRGVPLTVDDDGILLRFSTSARTVGEALHQVGVPLYQGDHIFPAPDALVTSGLTVAISRARPVTLEVDGATRLLRTRLASVQELLGETGVTLDPDDLILPGGETDITSGMHIAIVRVYDEYYVEEIPIPFETRWEANPELEIDQKRTASWGREGAWRQKVRVRYENGREVLRIEEEAWIAREPEDRILEYGTMIVVRQRATAHGVIEYWRRIRMLATSYSPSTAGKPPGHPTFGITRLGERARKGIIAVDPNIIAMRQWMYVPGYGLGYAGDTGGAIDGRRIDLGYDDDNLVLWLSWVDVYLLTPAPPASQITWVIPNVPRERE